MPLEIRELIIRAVVDEDEPSSAGAASAAGGHAPAPGAASAERARLVAECVEQVMEVLREQKER